MKSNKKMQIMSKNNEVCEINDNDFFKIYKNIERKRFRKRDLFVVAALCVIIGLSIYLLK